MSEVNAWSVSAASNNSAVPDGFPENMARSGVNNSARENMAALKRWQADTNGSVSSGGSANAYTFAANRTTTSAYAGETVTFKANHTNTGASTINITPSGGSARGTVALQCNGAALVGGQIVSGAIITARYDGAAYQIQAPVAFGRANTWTAAQTFSAGIIIGNADTTLTRSAAGVVDVEGHTLVTDDQAATISGAWTYTNGANFAQNTFNLLDTGGDHALKINCGENLSAGRTLTLVPGNSDRTLTISGAATISQDYSTTGTPRFARLGIGVAAHADVTINVANATAGSHGIDSIASGTGSTIGVYGQASDTGAGNQRAFHGDVRGSVGQVLSGHAAHATYVGEMITLNAVRAATSSYNFLMARSNDGGDTEINLRGDGTILSDNAATTPADYAEFFENEAYGILPWGSSVCLIDGKAALASDNPGETIIGVARPYGASAIVGNSHWARWSGKYERDLWGRYVLDANGDRILSPGFNPALPYMPRHERPEEWTIVGLVGQVAVLDGEPVNPSWVLMWEIDANTNMYLLR